MKPGTVEAVETPVHRPAGETPVRRPAGESRHPLVAVLAVTIGLRAADLVMIGIGGARLSGRRCPWACLGEGAINWDAHWYLGIASSGYSYVPGTDSNVAFFPGFPLLIRLLAPLVGGYAIAGLMLALAVGVIGVILVTKLVANDFGMAAGARAGMLLAAFPTAFFFAVPYADGLLLAFVAAAFVAARRRVWWLACAAAALAGTVRITGAFLLIPIAWEMLDSLEWNPRRIFRAAGLRTISWIVLAPAGIAAWSLWLTIRFGEPLAFVKAQFAGWPHRLTWFGEPIRYTAVQVMQPRGYLSGVRADLWWAYLLDLVVIAAMAAAAIAARKRLPGSYWTWWGMGVGASLLSGTTNSIARYVLVFFPFFAAAAILMRRRPTFIAAISVSSVLQLIAAYHFGMGWWVG